MTGVFLLNGTPTAYFDDEMNLLYFIREIAMLKGTKQGCDTGECGACTILVSGKPQRACKLKLSDVNGQSVTTIEGLKPITKLQQVLAAKEVFQCGHCASGTIMELTSLLAQKLRPTPQDIDKVLKNHFCRCTGYLPIKNAILELPYIEDMPKISPYEMAKVTGLLLYSADVAPPLALHVAVLRSPVARGILRGIRKDLALSIPGVMDVLTYKDIPGEKYFGRLKMDRPLLVDKEINYAGDALALVIAKNRETARMGCNAIIPAIEPLEPLSNPLQSDNTDYQVAEERFLVYPHLKGDIGVTKEYKLSINSQMVDHLTLELESAVAFEKNGILTVIAPSQNVFFDQMLLSKILNRKKDTIRFKQVAIGGAFGRREDTTAPFFVALAAVKTGRICRMTYSRAEEFRVNTKRHPFHMDFTAGVTLNEVKSLSVNIMADTGPYLSWAPNILRKAVVHASGPYSWERVRVDGKMIYSNTAFSGAFRGFGATQMCLGTEVFINYLAKELGYDPFEFRMKYRLTSNKRHATDQVLPGTDSSKLWTEGENIYKHWKDEVSAEKDRGIGVAWCHYGIGYGGGIPDISSIILEIDETGTLIVRCGIVDFGQGIRSVILNEIEKKIGLKADQVKIILGDTMYCPDSGSSVSSRVTVVIVNALLKALVALQEMVCEYFGRGKLHARGFHGETGLRLTYGQLASIARKKGVVLRVQRRHQMKTDLIPTNTSEGKAYARYTFGLQIADLSVNPEKGRVTVHRIAALYRLGKIASPEKAYGQITGGIAMGLGMALREQFYVDSSNIPMTTLLKQHGYIYPEEMPDIQVVFVDDPLPKNFDDHVGLSGIGEPAMLPTAPAIINAIEDACGILITNPPATPDKIKRALKRKDKNEQDNY
ncbi:MAG: molybdopterin-dependent oxidoreductase [Candidatus Coatesbacteria bacterium]|nr:molybdopterin-dependent oxidoreductase [Candidatus Coatesbacteria bacterium]